MWYILVQVVKAAGHGEDGHSNEQDPCDTSHPGPVVHAISRQEDGPHWQATLIQLQQALIVLQKAHYVNASMTNAQQALSLPAYITHSR